jgi:hypothetical protein
MAVFKTKTTVTDPNEAFSFPLSLQTAMTTLDAAMTARPALDAAILRNIAAILTAETAHADAEASLLEIEVRLAIEIDGTAASKLEEIADAARLARDTAEKAAARYTKIQSALFTKAIEADAAVAAARREMDVERTSFNSSALQALDSEIRFAVQGLIPILARANALHAMKVVGWNNPFLTETLIPAAAHGNPALVHGSKVTTPNGVTDDLAETWRDHASAVKLGLCVSSLHDLGRRAEMHRPFVPPAKPANLSEGSRQNRLAAEHNRLVDEREAAREAAEPKPTPWAGQVTSFENNKHYSSR